jgi:hypothetical protein
MVKVMVMVKVKGIDQAVLGHRTSHARAVPEDEIRMLH